MSCAAAARLIVVNRRALRRNQFQDCVRCVGPTGRFPHRAARGLRAWNRSSSPKLSAIEGIVGRRDAGAPISPALKLLEGRRSFIFTTARHRRDCPARSPNGLLDRRQAEEPQDQEPKHGLAHRVEGHEIPLCDLRVPRASAELLHLLAEEEEW